MASPRSIFGAQLACGLVLAAAARAAEPSSSFLGPNHNNDYGRVGLLTSWPSSGPRVLWRQKVGEGYSAVAATGGRVFALFQEGGQVVVRAYDAAAGKVLWSQTYAGAYKNSFGNGPRSTPIVEGDRLYTLGGRGHLHCWETQSGRILWQKNILSDFGAKNLKWGVSTTPRIDGARLLVNAGGQGASVVALDKKTGAVLWQSQSDTAGYASPVLLTAGGVRQAIFFTAQGLLSVTPDSGRFLWRHPWKTSYDVNAATPLVVDGETCFITSGYGTGCCLLKIGAGGVQQIWKNKVMASHFATPVVYQGHVYGFDGKAGQSRAKLKCLELRTGKQRWATSGFRHGQVILADGHLIILGERGQLALAEATPNGYAEKGRVQILSGRCWSVPVIGEGRLFVRNERELIALDATGRAGK